MSVQFGKCNFDGKPVDPKELDEIRPVLAPYGPDGEGLICKNNLAILYRAFHTTRESRGEKQPHLLPSGCVFTWDGRLDNREDLIERIGGRLNGEASDLEIAGAAYARWNTDSFALLIGDWALSIWDPRQESIILATDFIGTRHLYYSVEKEQVRWSTILDPLVLFAGHSLRLQEEYIAGWLAHFPATHLTPYEGIHSVPPACIVHLSRGGERTSHYWDFDPGKKIRYRTDAEYEEHFRQVFRESVWRRLRSDTPILAELSGGMDSSSIVCMADNVIASGNAGTPRLDTVSYYTDAEPNWDERPFFAEVELKRGRVGSHIEVKAEDTFHIDFDMSRIAATPNSGSCRSVASENFARLIRASQNRVLLSGIGGDEFTGGVPNPIPGLADLLIGVRLRTLAHQLKLWAVEKRKPWFHLALAVVARFSSADTGYNSYQAQPWLNADFARRNRRTIHGYATGWKIFGPRPSFQDHESTCFALQRQLAAAGLPSDPPFEKRYPYLDRDFLEFIGAIPPDQLASPGQRRSLMRRALARYLPQELLSRRRKGHVSRSLMVGVLDNYSRVSLFCRDMRSARMGFTNECATTAALLRTKEGLEIPMIPFMRTLAIEWWLRNLELFGVIQPDLPKPSHVSAKSNHPGSSAAVQDQAVTGHELGKAEM